MLDGKQVKDATVAAVKLASDVGGDGLASTLGVLSVNTNQGLEVAGDNVRISTTGTVTHTGGVHTHTIDTLQIIGTPDSGNDPINKTYADNLANGTRWKANADLTDVGANLTLSAEQTIDGILTSASRILVRNQTLGEENGIYITGAGAWTRATDMDAGTEADSAGVYVEGGTANGGTSWSQTVDSVTIGTTPQVYVQTNGAGSVDAGTGLTKTGNTINANGGNGIVANANDLAVDPDATTGVTVAPVAVGADGVGVTVDNDTIVHTAGTLSVGANAIGVAEIAEDEAFAFTAATTTTQSASDNSTKLASTAYVDSAVSVAGGSLSTNNREETPSVTSGNGATTGVTLTATADGDIRLEINGIGEILAGDKLSAAYFSADGGTTARALGAAVATDTLYWNGTIAGYELAATDILSLLYEV